MSPVHETDFNVMRRFVQLLQLLLYLNRTCTAILDDQRSIYIQDFNNNDNVGNNNNNINYCYYYGRHIYNEKVVTFASLNDVTLQNFAKTIDARTLRIYLASTM